MYSNSQLWSPVVKRSESWLKDCFLSAHLDSETDQGAQRVTATSCWKDPPEVVQHLNRILLTPPIGGFLGRTGQLPRADQHSVEGLFIPSDRRSSSKSRRWFCADNSYKCLRLVRASFQCWSFYFFFLYKTKCSQNLVSSSRTETMISVQTVCEQDRRSESVCVRWSSAGSRTLFLSLSHTHTHTPFDVPPNEDVVSMTTKWGKWWLI